MNAASLPLALAVVAGFFMSVQAPTNAILGKASGSAVVAAFISFLIGTLALGVAVAAGSGRLLAPELRAVPWYAWLGGLYGAFFVAMAAFGAPRIGIGPLLTAAIAGQLIGAIVLDHYGMIGLARQPVSPEKLAGAALVLIGAFIVRRG
ncbi:DMT family transporter [Sphingomonas sp. SM33]|uniref:DMT family transporter n=1 Tax=Sphingomonas telluris TaxID=2907998 RepID=A0ABS9VMY8_9SPHN|nr:DMT family transporter [Sphingomonas telluris]MCH8616328.1 DMT family transporter [Sphingomonas telluris]